MDEILETYLKKVSEIQGKENNRSLSQDELKLIALDAGISESDFLIGKSTSLMKGQSFLKNSYWEEAVKELRYFLIANPFNAEALYSMALAYSGLYQSNGLIRTRNQAIFYAKLSLQMQSDNDTARQLINALQGNTVDEKENYQTQTTNSPQNTATNLILGCAIVGAIIVMAVAGAVFFIAGSNQDSKEITDLVEIAKAEDIQSFFSDPNISFTRMQVATGSKGSVMWVVGYKQIVTDKIERKHFICIIDPVNQKILESITLANDVGSAITQTHWDNFTFAKNGFYNFKADSNYLEIRDIYTGKIILNNESLVKSYPVLNEGIGTMKKNNDWFEITTRKGNVFFYNPVMDKMASGQEKKAIDSDYTNQKGWVHVYDWIKVKSDLKSSIALTKRKTSPFNINSDNSRSHLRETEKEKFVKQYDVKNKRRGDELLFFNQEKEFLNPLILYQDSTLIVLKNFEEIGQNATAYWVCMDNQGKILWEIKDEKKNRLLSYFDEAFKGGFLAHRYEDKLAVSILYLKIGDKFYPYACEIDLKSGAVNWEYSPKYKTE